MGALSAIFALFFVLAAPAAVTTYEVGAVRSRANLQSAGAFLGQGDLMFKRLVAAMATVIALVLLTGTAHAVSPPVIDGGICTATNSGIRWSGGGEHKGHKVYRRTRANSTQPWGPQKLVFVTSGNSHVHEYSEPRNNGQARYIVSATDGSTSSTRSNFFHCNTLPPYFVGGFETGNLSQWPYLGDANGVSVVRAPTFGSGSAYAAKAVTGDDPDSSNSGDASYVEMNSFEHPWQNDGVAWHRIEVLFPSGTNPSYPGTFTPSPRSVGWNMFMEWHEQGACPASSYAGVWNNGNGTARLLLRLAGGDPADPTLKWIEDADLLIYDHWYEVLVKMDWSSDPNVGHVEWWVDGKQKFSAHFPTLYKEANGCLPGVLFETGHYRKTATWTDTLYWDGVRVGPTRNSVASG